MLACVRVFWHLTLALWNTVHSPIVCNNVVNIFAISSNEIMHENGQWPSTRLTTSTAVAATATSNGATNDKPKMGNCEHKVTNYNELKRWMLRFICFFFLSWNLPGAKSMYFVRPFSSNFCIHLKPGNGGEKKCESVYLHIIDIII